MRLFNQQRGNTLPTALIMLVLLTLVAISSINSSSSSVEMVGNMQFHEESNAAGQQAIENVVSTPAFKTTPPAAQTIDVNGDGTADYSVAFTPAPSCIRYQATVPTDANVPAECYGSTGALCYWTIWDVTAVVTDLHGSGATATVHQGVRTIAGINAALASCGI